MAKPLVEFTGREMQEQLELLAKAYKNIYPRVKNKYLGRALTKSARPLVKIYKQVAKQRYPGALQTYTTKGGKTKTRRARGGLEQSAGISKPKSASRRLAAEMQRWEFSLAIVATLERATKPHGWRLEQNNEQP